VIRARLAEFTACYERALVAQPTLAGKVAATFTIAPDGSVGTIVVAGFSPDVDACIAAVVATLSFASAPGSVPTKVNYPFVFRRQ
jgi:hypothetical protein